MRQATFTQRIIEDSNFQRDKKMNILYIGQHQDVINELKNYPDYPLNVSKFNVVLKAKQWLAEQNTPPSAVICDKNLTGIKTEHFIQELKKLPLLKGVPCFVVGTGINEKEILTYKQIKITDFYLLPLNVNVLVKRIQTAKRVSNYQQNVASSKDFKIKKMPFAKRLFDIFFSGLALLMLSPLFLIVAIAIKIESRGPIFYSSKRVGTGYSIINFWKFRSMYSDADTRLKDLKHLNQYADEGIIETFKCNCQEEKGAFCCPILHIGDRALCEKEYLFEKRMESGGAFIKIKNDPRVTKVGKLIRNTSIDELPQLWNVFVGDMSIVGNRPLPLYEAELLTSDAWSQRFMAPAGITGLWQVSKRGKGEMSDEERKELDNEYARNFSFWGDIKLILRTIPALFQKENV